MKVFCKRTKFNRGDEEQKWGYVRWKKDVWYNYREPNNYESKHIYCYILTEDRDWALSKSDFDKYFYTKEDLRDLRINNILR